MVPKKSYQALRGASPAWAMTAGGSVADINSAGTWESIRVNCFESVMEFLPPRVAPGTHDTPKSCRQEITANKGCYLSLTVRVPEHAIRGRRIRLTVFVEYVNVV